MELYLNHKEVRLILTAIQGYETSLVNMGQEPWMRDVFEDLKNLDSKIRVQRREHMAKERESA